jgi:hypothetical protein
MSPSISRSPLKFLQFSDASHSDLAFRSTKSTFGAVPPFPRQQTPLPTPLPTTTQMLLLLASMTSDLFRYFGGRKAKLSELQPLLVPSSRPALVPAPFPQAASAPIALPASTPVAVPAPRRWPVRWTQTQNQISEISFCESHLTHKCHC